VVPAHSVCSRPGLVVEPLASNGKPTCHVQVVPIITGYHRSSIGAHRADTAIAIEDVTRTTRVIHSQYKGSCDVPSPIGTRANGRRTSKWINSAVPIEHVASTKVEIVPINNASHDVPALVVGVCTRRRRGG